MVDTTWVSPPPGEQAVDLAAMPPSQARRSKGERLRCSFCQAELGKDKLMTSDSGNNRPRMSSSRFCSPRCRDCVLALAALNPSPLASDAFVSSRAVLTDRLLDLWRSGQGPDPALVLQAALTAGSGLAAPTPSD
jgi:hypothetical protein